MNNKTKGISLIVLVITIIVIIVLAGAVVISILQNNPISTANEAVFKSDLVGFRTELNMYITERYSSTLGVFNSELLRANDLTLEYAGEVIEGKTIKDIIPSLAKTNKYNGQLKIVNGKLTYIGLDTTLIQWAKQVDLEVTDIDDIPPVNPIMSTNITTLTNGDVLVTIIYPEDAILREYSIDGISWSIYTEAILVTTNNTTVYSRGTDSSGNQSLQSTITITNIDKLAPSVPTVNFNGYIPGTWTSSNITLNLTSTDDNSGVSKYQMSTNGTTWTDFPSSKIYSSDMSQSMSFRAIDNIGNISNATVTYNLLRETVIPTYSSYSITNVTSTTYDVNVFGVTDTISGINRVQFPTWTTFNNQDDLQPNWSTNPIATGQNLGGGTWKYTVKRSDHNNEVGTYVTHVYIFDNAGNSAYFGPPNVNIVDSTLVGKFYLTSVQEVFNGNTSYIATGEVSNNYTIQFKAYPSDTIGILTENTSDTSQTSIKHRFVIFDVHGGAVPNVGLGVSLGTNGLAIIAHSDGYYHVLLTYYADLNAWNNYKIVVQNRVPSLYVNGVLVKTGYPPLPVYTKIFSRINVGKGSYGNYIGKANYFEFYNVIK